jgi:hypothetical protein
MNVSSIQKHNYRKGGKVKRFILVLSVLGLVLLVAGCSVTKTYFHSTGTGATAFCWEVVTANADTQNALGIAGYTEGTCSANGFATTHYCALSGGTGSNAYTINEYWPASLSAADAQSACTLAGGTYH